MLGSQHGAEVGHCARSVQLCAQLLFPAASCTHAVPALQHCVLHGLAQQLPPMQLWPEGQAPVGLATLHEVAPASEPAEHEPQDPETA
jgi:hypothetical protein